MLFENQFINLDNAPFQVFELSTMLTENKLELKKKLKIELVHVRSATEKIAAKYERMPHELDRQFSLTSESGHTVSGKEKRKSFMNNLSKNMDSCSEIEMVIPKKSKVEYIAPGASKRESQKKLEAQKGKKQRMDSVVIQQCAGILKKLMSHPAGWVFNQPVDPVELDIPDYFSIISKPMDLGTIKSKLEKKLYSGIEEFAADVRLTFSNAMLYNPPTNNVHHMAKELNDIFNSRWKSLEGKCSRESSKVGRQADSNQRQKKTNGMRQVCNKMPTSRVNLLSKRLMSFTDKQKLREDLVEISKRKLPPHLLGFLRTFGLIGQNEEKIEVDIDAFDDETARELQRMIKIYLDDFTQASSSDIDSDRSLGRDNHNYRGGAFNLDPLANDTVNARMSKSDPDSDGAVSTVDEENVPPSSRPATPTPASASGEGWEDPLYDGKLSPSKALRAAILKSRFADTILKAQLGEKGDPVKMQQERERLERKQREEKVRIEAQIRATEAASRMRAENELKMQREREREAARIALQKMERTVEIDENQQILKDLEMLGGFSQPGHLIDGEVLKCSIEDGFGNVLGIYQGNPLEQLGLFMKDDYMEEEEEETNLNGEVEEGEIGS